MEGRACLGGVRDGACSSRTRLVVAVAVAVDHEGGIENLVPGETRCCVCLCSDGNRRLTHRSILRFGIACPVSLLFLDDSPWRARAHCLCNVFTFVCLSLHCLDQFVLHARSSSSVARASLAL